MSATPSAEMLVVQGMAWICLPKRSVHTKMASYPLESGSWVIRSTPTSSQSLVGTSRGCVTAHGWCWSFFCAQVSHPSTYFSMKEHRVGAD